MKRLSAIAVLAFLPFGCTSSPPGGVAGTKNKFELSSTSGTTLPLSLKQGDKQTITISVKRDSEFKQDVALTVEAPKGIHTEWPKQEAGVSVEGPKGGKVEIKTPPIATPKYTLKPGDNQDVSLSISADKDAVGDHIVKVVGTPQNGTATYLDIKVKVSAP